MGGANLDIDNGSALSLCFGGTYQGKPALLTCGHNTYIGAGVKNGGRTGGKVVARNFPSSVTETTNGEYSIIEITGDFTPTNQVGNRTGVTTIVGPYYFPPVGTAIAKFGRTTGYTEGTVTAVDQTIKVPDTYGSIAKLTLCSMTPGFSGEGIAQGDSGGSVYLPNYSGGARLCGLATAKASATQMYVSSIYYCGDFKMMP